MPKNPHAVSLGQTKSARKAASSRRNAKLGAEAGGRPRVIGTVTLGNATEVRVLWQRTTGQVRLVPADTTWASANPVGIPTCHDFDTICARIRAAFMATPYQLRMRE